MEVYLVGDAISKDRPLAQQANSPKHPQVVFSLLHGVQTGAWQVGDRTDLGKLQFLQVISHKFLLVCNMQLEFLRVVSSYLGETIPLDKLLLRLGHIPNPQLVDTTHLLSEL